MVHFAAAAVSAFAAVAAAAPAANLKSRNSNNGFIIHQSANPNYKPNGPVAYAKALAKYGATEKASQIISAVEAASSGTVTASSVDNDVEYLCPVTIGTQTFKLDFDTGSSDLWVLGNKVSGAGSGHTTYQPGANAKQIQGASWKIQYGDGSGAAGTVYTDTVNIGGVTVTGQAVEAATSAAQQFTSGQGDGLVGLAFDNINTVTPTKQKTFLTNAIAQGLPKAVMATTLKYHAAGTYDFGAIIASRYNGTIAYTDVDSSQGFWTFTPASYAVGSGAAAKSNLVGIADTGTTLMLVPTDVVQAYYKQVQGAKNDAQQGGFTFPCSATLPSFTLQIGDYKAVVPGKFINFAPLQEGSQTCFGGIQATDAQLGLSIYGDVFLKSQYVVFDRSQSTPRLGFAAQA